MTKRAWALSCLLWPLLSVSAQAEEFYVDPAAGSMANDGSAARPWSTLEDVIASGLIGTTVAAGDTVWLLSGYHGELDLNGGGSFEPPVTLAAMPDAMPELARARFGDTSGVTLRGASISPSHGPGGEGGPIVEIGDGASHITVEDCDVFSENDASGWSADQWVNQASNGIEVSGGDAVVRGNTVRNVRFGISVDGVRALIDRNVIDGFSADGMRGLGDDETFQYNVVKNVYVDGDLDDNHDDGFQSWTIGEDGEVGTGEVRGMVLRGNLILNYEDPNQPFRATLQGIGCFDGTFVDWVVENNVVITDHWHGITLLGARNSRIVNNTVLDVNGEDPGPPWISIDAHKDGTPPEGCVVRNNLATDFVNADSVTTDHNLVIEDAAALFVDPAAHDLHLLPNAMSAIDQGIADLAPALDADRIERPQGAAIDLGAFEWHEANVEPIDDGGTSPPSVTPDAGPSPAGSSGSAGSSGAGGAAPGTPSMPSTGGAVAMPGGSAGSSPADPSTPSPQADESGCGCHTVGSSRAGGSALTLGAALLGALLRRRTRRRR